VETIRENPNFAIKVLSRAFGILNFSKDKSLCFCVDQACLEFSASKDEMREIESFVSDRLPPRKYPKRKPVYCWQITDKNARMNFVKSIIKELKQIKQ